MNEKTIDGFTLAEVLGWEAGARKDAVLAGLLGNDLKARDDVGNEIPDICAAMDAILQPRKGFFDKQDCANERVLVGKGKEYQVPASHIVPDYDDMFCFWQTREGKPYQADLEAAVSAWRRVAPAYSTDWAAMGALIDLMLSRGYTMQSESRFSGTATPHNVLFGFRTEGLTFAPWHEADTLPHAVTNAAIAAMQALVSK